VSAIPSCGDALLPADYAGPPAGEISGTVVAGAGAGSKDAARPRLSLEWLASAEAAEGGTTLLGQPLSYQRSARLQSDWDIGLALPIEGARAATSAGSQVRVGVAKMVYFDDRDQNGALDWACVGARCDVVKAVSAEFVVYVDNPPACPPRLGGAGLKGRMTPGYHYYRFDNGQLRELGVGGAMSFVVTERSLAENDPTADLLAFRQAFLRSLTLHALDGC
jgi:hypothetical protein